MVQGGPVFSKGTSSLSLERHAPSRTNYYLNKEHNRATPQHPSAAGVKQQRVLWHTHTHTHTHATHKPPSGPMGCIRLRKDGRCPSGPKRCGGISAESRRKTRSGPRCPERLERQQDNLRERHQLRRDRLLPCRTTTTRRFTNWAELTGFPPIVRGLPPQAVLPRGAAIMDSVLHHEYDNHQPARTFCNLRSRAHETTHILLPLILNLTSQTTVAKRSVPEAKPLRDREMSGPSSLTSASTSSPLAVLCARSTIRTWDDGARAPSSSS
jgi:hypothetical protein